MNTICKRFIDLILATIGLIVAAPIMGLITLLLKLESSGNVIFSQERLGFHGKPFRLYKFRKFPAHWRDAGPRVTVAGDTRMTPIGRFLERIKLDELPQLWNILKGDMSFVGPRPECLCNSGLFIGKYAVVLEYMPGIFGPNQVAYRNESELYPADEDPEAYYCRELFPRKSERDLAYFKKANFLKDCIWIIRGLWATLSGVIHWHHFMYAHAKIIATDILLTMIAWLVANLIRFSGLPAALDFNGFITGLWILPLVVISTMFVAGCYRHPVRYFSFEDGIRMLRVVPVAWIVGFLFLLGFVSKNLSFYLIPEGCLFLLPLLAIPRILQRIKWEKRKSIEPVECHRVLIYGAGRLGTSLAHWMRTPSNGLILYGFLDDDCELRGNLINGYKVQGRESDIPTIYEVHKINEIWLTFQPDEMKRNRLHEICEKLAIRLVIVPELEPFSRFFPTAPKAQ